MKPQEYRTYVLDKLILLERKVEILGSLNLRDINLDCENFYRDLLNLLFDLKLENSNVIKANHDTFDLYDNEARKVYQVTSSVSRSKVNKTINQFQNKYLSDYDELYMVFLNKKNLIESPNRKIITPFKSTFGFNVSLHILDNEDIIKQFDNLIIDKKIAAYELVQKYFEESLLSKDSYRTFSKIPKQVILNKFHQASHHLLDYNDGFDGVSDSHIQRKETTELLNWINNPIPPEEESVALLVGDAGLGKTVILKDLLLELEKTNIPAIGLKADRYYAESLGELEQKIHLEDGLEQTLNTLTREGETAVILIDQIDALSQSLSAKRQYIDCYNLLVRKLLVIHNVRIILSVRSYDLNYDTDLSFYKKQRSFSVGFLQEEQVLSILDKLKIERQKVPKDLLDLLKTPHHLNVFCKVYRSDLNLGSINTLHDLYAKLWYQRITLVPPEAKTSIEKLQDLLFAIAQRMYQDQQISTFRETFHDSYLPELEYLKSNGILLETDNQIQFFHQTFFDYVFAKQFIAGNNSILDYLKDNHQGLFVRSSIKMILGFLREQNHSMYVQILNKLLFSKKYRFHLKLMALNILGYQESPTIEEKSLVSKKILTSLLLKPFLESVDSSGWLKFLIQEDVITSLLITPRQMLELTSIQIILQFLCKRTTNEEKEESLRNLCFQIFQRRLPKDRNIIASFLIDVDKFPSKESYVFRFLYFIKQWDFDEAFILYEKYKNASEQDWFGHYKIMEDMLEYRFEFVLDEYKLTFQKKLKSSKDLTFNKNISHYDEELYKKIFQTNPDKAFPYFLDFLERTGKLHSPFFNYSEINSDQSHGIDLVLALLKEYVRKRSIEAPEWFKNFYQKYNTSEYEVHQMMIYEGLNSNPAVFKKEVFEFLIYWISSPNLEYAGTIIHYFSRKLVGTTFSSLYQSQQEQLEQNLLRISPKFEKELTISSGRKSHTLKHYGYTQLLYIQALPKEVIFSRPNFKRRFLELQRKFNKATDLEPNRFSISAGGTPPMTQQSYGHMSHDDWIATFKKYNKSFSKAFGFANGSLLEHSRSFETEVGRRPEFFIPLIKRIIDENSVDQNYITAGLSGLQKAKIDANLLQQIFQSSLNINFDRDNILSLVWLSSYFVETRVIDESTLDFLIDMALHHPDPEDRNIRNDAIMDAANNVRGAATGRIIKTYFKQDFEVKIFDALHQIANDPHISVRVALIDKMAYLNHLNKEKTFDLFLNLVESGVPEILRHSGWSAQYFAKEHFKKLFSYFNQMMEIESAHSQITTILAVEWISGRDEAYPFLKKLFIKSDKAKAIAIEVAARNLNNSDELTIKRCRKLFSVFLISKSDKVATAYNHEFLHLSEELFIREYRLLDKYSKSVVCKKQPGYYLLYLLKCVKKHPIKCLRLLKRVTSYEKTNISQSGHFDEEPMKVLIGAYNSLNSISPKPMKHLENTMKLFDKLLMDERFRTSATKAIDLVDR